MLYFLGDEQSLAIWRRLLSPIIDLTNLFLNWRFSIPFIVNQTASILFVMLVSRFPVSVVVPCVNALQFVFTAVTGHVIGEYTTHTYAVPESYLNLAAHDSQRRNVSRKRLRQLPAHGVLDIASAPEPNQLN
ncbi:hypothetical protein COOONC_26732 [Cooperia oncophora]